MEWKNKAYSFFSEKNEHLGSSYLTLSRKTIPFSEKGKNETTWQYCTLFRKWRAAWKVNNKAVPQEVP